MGFYVKYGHGQEGPYELVSMIRKIRNREISRETLVMSEEDPKAVAAYEHPQLQTFFDEIVVEHNEEGLEPYLESDGMFYAFKKGWALFQQYPNSIIYAAAYIFGTVLIALLFHLLLGPLAAIITGVFTFYFLKPAILFCFFKLYSGQAVRKADIVDIYKTHSKQLMIFAVLMSLCIVIGSAFLVIPALLAATFFMMAPMLIMDEHISAKAAMAKSYQLIKGDGRRFFEVLFSLVVLNFIAGLFFLFPLALTLPLTYFAFQDIYNRISLTR